MLALASGRERTEEQSRALLDDPGRQHDARRPTHDRGPAGITPDDRSSVAEALVGFAAIAAPAWPSLGCDGEG